MKVLFVVPRFHTNQLEWIKLLKEYNHEIAIYAQFQGSIEDYREIKPNMIKPSLISMVRLYLINMSKEKDNIKSLKRMKVFSPSVFNLYLKLKKFKPDIVICRDRTKLTAITHFICKLLRLKCVLYNQTPYYSPGDKSHFKRILGRIIFPKYRMTPVLGENSEDKIVKNNFYIPFAVSTKMETKKSYLKDGRINILSIGKFYERKNHTMLIEVCRRLLENSFNIHLTIIGESSNVTNEHYLKKVKETIQENKLNKYITIRTNISHEQMFKEYINNDVFVLASTREQAAVSHLEAMGHGLLSISSDTNGTASYIEDGKTGYLFKDLSKDDLFLKLKEICSNPNQINIMGKNARYHVQKNYSGKAIYEKFDNLFKRLTK
ncbi:glycosyltransferase family 4 protein [Rossellomorea vietnamensis]|uniref:glycosyltransferase family 4 protein n=1 Tax=Rossellomorea vietnamensis TaxID=218284 RepID=UPI003CF2F541